LHLKTERDEKVSGKKFALAATFHQSSVHAVKRRWEITLTWNSS
jgi:hypothetical protein